MRNFLVFSCLCLLLFVVLLSSARGGPVSLFDGRLLLSGEREPVVGGPIDVSDRDLIISATADDRLTVLDWVTRQVRQARQSRDWMGHKIISSLAGSNRNMGLAVVLNDDGTGRPIFSSLGGRGVDTNSIVVRCTWNGDLNLDGKVDISDYFLMDRGFLERKSGYQNGDLNLDGVVDISDYFLIDSAFLNQGTMVPRAARAPLVMSAQVSDPPSEGDMAAAPLPSAAWAGLGLLAVLGGMYARRQVVIWRGKWRGRSF